jgi:transcription termination/antitermination protein NusG
MDDEAGLGILPTDAQPKKAKAAKPAAEEKPEAAVPADLEEALAQSETHILCLKTQVGQERRVAEMLGNKARRFNLPVMSLLAPQELRGYVFIETRDPLAIEKGIRGVSYARALVTREEEQLDENGEFLRDRRGKVVTRKIPVDVPFSEIAHFLTPVSAVAKIAEGDIVELVSGPFRGEKAKVTRVDDAREEITVELIESMVPIPITVKGEHVRVLEKGA